MTLTQLEYAVALARYRHFGKAAKARSVSQPTLSMQIQKLEEELGLTLFDRSRSPVLVTPEGEGVLEQARVVLREARRLEEAARQSGDVLSGPFHLGVLPTLSAYILPLFVGHFIERHPRVELVIEELLGGEILRRLREDELDAGLVVTPIREQGLFERVLFYEPFHLFVSPDHPLSKRKSVREAELDVDELWLLEHGHCLREQALRICSEGGGGRASSKRGVRFESGSLETLKSMVLSSSGYTLLPELAVRALPSSQRRFVRPFAEPAPTREISLVHARETFRHRILVALESEISDALPKRLRALKRRDVELVTLA